ncbi:MAG TPA: tetratricopeptide repeat protein [Candidatus Saccharimonadales bacterium]|nr:tetratricopeptide repeat protein [Candidatus Saccharimonadales bacterium]
MKHKLPLPQTKALALFPKNHRLITEFSFSEAQSRNIKIFLVSVVSLFLITLIFFQVVTLQANIRQQQSLVQDRSQLQDEAAYWERIANKYQGYRDVYYRIAFLQYKLGNYTESQKYVKKALELDPNFPEGHVLGASIGL